MVEEVNIVKDCRRVIIPEYLLKEVSCKCVYACDEEIPDKLLLMLPCSLIDARFEADFVTVVDSLDHSIRRRLVVLKTLPSKNKLEAGIVEGGGVGTFV